MGVICERCNVFVICERCKIGVISFFNINIKYDFENQ